MTEEKKVFTVNDYYKEQNPKKRKKILEVLLDQNDSEENQMRRELFGLRYGGKNQRKDGDLADSYIGLWMNMKMLVNSSSGFFGNRSARKELKMFSNSNLTNAFEFNGGDFLIYNEILQLDKTFVLLLNLDLILL